MTRNSLLVVSLSAVLASGAAFAATQADKTAASPAAAPHAMQLDKNGDGVVDRAEAAAYPRLAEHFDSIDTNKDGKLSADEMQQARMARRDSDHRDGHRDGHHGQRGMGMMKLDTDKDGRISRAEAAADEKFAARFDTMDANADGFVDRADFQARMAQRRGECFDKADLDKDGKLSREEFSKAGEACRPRMRAAKAPTPVMEPATPAVVK